MRLDLEIMGEQQVSRDLLRIGDRAGSMRPAFHRIAQQLTQVEGRQFDTQGASGSGGWAPLKEATKRRKAAAGLDPRILRATERLRRSLISLNAPDQTLQITDDFLRFGTTVPYARFHQTGTARMPQRKVVDLSETNRRSITKTMQRWMLTGEV